MSTENQTIEVLQHNISYWYEDDHEMPDYEQDHVREMIIDGFSSGQLVDDEVTGWWKIDNLDSVQKAAPALLEACKAARKVLFAGPASEQLDAAISAAEKE